MVEAPQPPTPTACTKTVILLIHTIPTVSHPPSFCHIFVRPSLTRRADVLQGGAARGSEDRVLPSAAPSSKVLIKLAGRFRISPVVSVPSSRRLSSGEGKLQGGRREKVLRRIVRRGVLCPRLRVSLVSVLLQYRPTVVLSLARYPYSEGFLPLVVVVFAVRALHLFLWCGHCVRISSCGSRQPKHLCVRAVDDASTTNATHSIISSHRARFFRVFSRLLRWSSVGLLVVSCRFDLVPLTRTTCTALSSS